MDRMGAAASSALERIDAKVLLCILRAVDLDCIFNIRCACRRLHDIDPVQYIRSTFELSLDEERRLTALTFLYCDADAGAPQALQWPCRMLPELLRARGAEDALLYGKVLLSHPNASGGRSRLHLPRARYCNELSMCVA